LVQKSEQSPVSISRSGFGGGTSTHFDRLNVKAQWPRHDPKGGFGG